MEQGTKGQRDKRAQGQREKGQRDKGTETPMEKKNHSQNSQKYL